MLTWHLPSPALTPGEDLHKVLWLKSRNSEVWLERRTSYTRSTAVMSMVRQAEGLVQGGGVALPVLERQACCSMHAACLAPPTPLHSPPPPHHPPTTHPPHPLCLQVGYILGLGDRHPSNLMLDRYSGAEGELETRGDGEEHAAGSVGARALKRIPAGVRSCRAPPLTCAHPVRLPPAAGKLLHIDFGDCFEASMNREKFPEKVGGWVGGWVGVILLRRLLHCQPPVLAAGEALHQQAQGSLLHSAVLGGNLQPTQAVPPTPLAGCVPARAGALPPDAHDGESDGGVGHRGQLQVGWAGSGERWMGGWVGERRTACAPQGALLLRAIWPEVSGPLTPPPPHTHTPTPTHTHTTHTGPRATR